MLPGHATRRLWTFLLPAWPLTVSELEIPGCSARSMDFRGDRWQGDFQFLNIPEPPLPHLKMGTPWSSAHKGLTFLWGTKKIIHKLLREFHIVTCAINK